MCFEKGQWTEKKKLMQQVQLNNVEQDKNICSRKQGAIQDKSKSGLSVGQW